MKSYETELLRMSMQLLDIRGAPPPSLRNVNVEPLENSPETTIESIESTLSELHDTPEEVITATISPITPRSLTINTATTTTPTTTMTTPPPGEKLNRHLMDLMEHNNLMKRKIQMLNGNDGSCPSPISENISI